MPFPDGLTATPWDLRTLRIPTWEVTTVTAAVLDELESHPGHYTVKVDPLADKGLLHRYGFYYCDTLLEPFADRKRFVDCVDGQVSLDHQPPREAILHIAHGAFRHGRFHRDFNLDPALADLRYDRWIEDLLDEGNCCGIGYGERLAAFVGYRGNKLVLHAVAEEFQGRGLAKFLWSRMIRELFEQGHDEICSSVSAANLAIVNLYATLGFRFRHPLDIYHRLVR